MFKLSYIGRALKQMVLPIGKIAVIYFPRSAGRVKRGCVSDRITISVGGKEMRTGFRRIIASLLALSLLFMMTPVAFAEEEDDSVTLVSSYDELVAALKAGKPVKLTEDIAANGPVAGTDVSIDLNDKTLTLDDVQNSFSGISTIQNGEICITGVEISSDAIICIGEQESRNSVLNLVQVDLTGSGYCSAFAVFRVCGASTLNVTGGTWTLSEERSAQGGVVKNQNGTGTEGTIRVTGTTMKMDRIGRGFAGGTVTLDDVDLTIIGSENGISNCALSVKDSTLRIRAGDQRRGRCR